MRRRRLRPVVAGLVTFVLVVMIGVLAMNDFSGDGSGVAAETPADRSTLQNIAQKNDDAATRAAAQMRLESRRSSDAADAIAANQIPSAPAAPTR
jgi:hypothetical protein